MYCTETMTLTAGTRTLRVDLRLPCFATPEAKHATAVRYLDRARQSALGVGNAITLAYTLAGVSGRIR
jgi:hypothetical protein